MEIVMTVGEMQKMAEQFRLAGKTIAVVPTMGALHDGHRSLISVARSHCDTVIVTVFVNPTQFGPNEDFKQYPRDFERDAKIAKDEDADILFHPDVTEMYPDGFLTYVTPTGVAETLEGAVRPGHFRGVATVVAKLLHSTLPHIAVFGQKDAQQVFIVRQMVRDLNIDVRIVVAPIVREEDGLAMSSRNRYLDSTERKRAASLYRSLKEAEKMITEGERDADTIRHRITGILEGASPTGIDYVAIIDPATFRETADLDGPEILIALAVRFGLTRLIDNTTVSLN